MSIPMVEWALGLGIANFIILILLWVKTSYMTKMIFLLGEANGWNDEEGRWTGNTK